LVLELRGHRVAKVMVKIGANAGVNLTTPIQSGCRFNSSRSPVAAAIASTWRIGQALGLAFIGGLALMIAASTGASAHHSIGGEFINSAEVSVVGIVKEFRLINPHTYIVLEVEDENGVHADWTLTYGPATKLIRGMGWSLSTLKKGETLSATGRPARQGHGMYLSSLERADGTKLLTELIE
jgi:hypothetical protein